MRKDTPRVAIAAFISLATYASLAVAATNVNLIIEKSRQVTEADREATPDYDYSETDAQPNGSTKTYAVHMLDGSPYRELIATDGKQLSADEHKDAKRKLRQEIDRRRRESPGDRAHRVAEFEKEQNRDKRFIEELTQAFTFKVLGGRTLRNRRVYLVQATPRPGYHPPDKTAQVLTGMQGRLWIDTQTYQWVKVEADVTHPVSIEGFLAKVEPGTRFELEKIPVGDGIWLPSHFQMTADAKILSVVGHHSHENETYFNYRKAATPQTTGDE